MTNALTTAPKENGTCSKHGRQLEFRVSATDLRDPNCFGGCPHCYVDWQRSSFNEFLIQQWRKWERDQ